MVATTPRTHIGCATATDLEREGRDECADRPRDDTAALLLRAATAGPAERNRLQNQVVVRYLAVAHTIARRYFNRGLPDADLDQAAATALLLAARRYDPSREVPFLPFAIATIRGEVRRQFRDHAWMIRPTRSLQQLRIRARTAEAELVQQLGRSPRISEIAEHLDAPLEDVVEAVSIDDCYTPASLDTPLGDSGDSAPTLAHYVADDTPAATDLVENHLVLASALQHLDPEDRRMLKLRFSDSLTQAEIARRLGTTQMQISRRLHRVLNQLREHVAA